MALKTIVVTTCDLCDKEADDAKEHEIRVDRKGVKLHACTECWAGTMERFNTIYVRAGRRIRRQRQK